MSLITQQPIWEADVYQIDTTDPVLGGPEGPLNAAAKSLANRTLFLHTTLTASGGLGKAVLINSGDLNSVQKPGFYSIGETVTNIPGTSADRGHLIVSGAPTGPSGGGTAAVVQMFFSRTGEVYHRQLSALVWEPWFEFLTTRSMARLNPMPAGSLLHFAGAVTPVGFIKAQGQLLSRAVYPELFTAIGELYGPGDGSTTFQLPDLRGEFLRGLDDGAGNDPGRVLGSNQADDNKLHNHSYSQYIPESPAVLVNTVPGGQFAVPNGQVNNNTATQGSESRPQNVAVNILIRY